MGRKLFIPTSRKFPPDRLLLPWPMDFKILPGHQRFAEKHGKSILWLNNELDRCRDWHIKKAVLRTDRGWPLAFNNWLKQAILFESEKAAGATAYANGGYATPRQPILPPLDGREIFEHARKYKQMLKENPEAAEKYLAHVPERMRKLIK